MSCSTAVSSSAILDAHERTHGARILPHYRFDQADVVVAFGADFLGTWISPVEFTTAWTKQRVPSEQSPQMSYHLQIESRMSLTGSNADRRVAVRPVEQGQLIARLAEKIAELANTTDKTNIASTAIEAQEELLTDTAKRLWESRGKCLVISDSQDVDVQCLVNFINHLLENYDTTLEIQKPSNQRAGNDRDVAQLVQELIEGKVGALLVADFDLLHDLANISKLSQSIEQVPLTISFAPREDEFSSQAKYVCPDHHALESWSDAEPIAGLVSLAQPTIRPIGKTRSILESLSHWNDEPTTAYAALQKYWESEVYPQRDSDSPNDFQQFWQQALHNGFVEVAREAESADEFNFEAVQPLAQQEIDDNFSLILYSKVAMPDSRHAHNPWLHELPDPVSKVTWDNYVCLSSDDAEELGIQDGDIVAVEANEGVTIELPALVQPGQPRRVLAISLAYGCKGTDRFANIGPQWFEAQPTVPEGGLVGKNAAGFIDLRDGNLQYTCTNVSLSKTSKHRQLAATQMYNSLEMPPEVAPHGAEHREIVQQTTLAAFAKDSHSGAEKHHHHSEEQLWPEDHPKPGHAWGMVIDLNKCTGCSACVIACQSENNVPVVGYDEVRRQREMHWMRIDRYYSNEDSEVDVAHQPMMCQHCDNAPCETVCPVLATVHSSEGLNEQVYNRCVGTRYCANNCPYKVRRFNWFKYPHDDSLQNLVLNPEVTVRSRGVMEKCSMCVQRIEAGKVEARKHGLPVKDGDIQTACQQSCPAQAIVFGDMNDPKSQISQAAENPRRYQVLEELNVRPSVSYLRVVRNRDEESHRG